MLKDKFGYIDKTGKYVVNPQYDAAHDFSDGLALVKSGEKYGYIDETGSYVINPQFDNALDFSYGLAAVEVGEKYGYIDKEGNYVINPQYRSATSFTDDGYIIVTMDMNIDKEDGWGYIQSIIDKNGNTIKETEYKYLYD